MIILHRYSHRLVQDNSTEHHDELEIEQHAKKYTSYRKQQIRNKESHLQSASAYDTNGDARLRANTGETISERLLFIFLKK